jgi:hypothetical protein
MGQRDPGFAAQRPLTKAIAPGTAGPKALLPSVDTTKWDDGRR